MTRPWWMAVGPLLAWGMLLSACNGPPCTVAPFLGGRVVAQNTDGTFSMSWSEVQAIATATDFAPEVGEVGHLLQPVEHGTTADIAPTRRDWSALPDPATYSNELNKMGCGQITAQVTASGPHAPLGFAAGLNYLVVWLDWQPNKLIGGKWTTFHMAAVNESSRKQYETPRYTPHWAFTNTGPIDSTKAKLSPGTPVRERHPQGLLRRQRERLEGWPIGPISNRSRLRFADPILCQPTMDRLRPVRLLLRREAVPHLTATCPSPAVSSRRA